MICFDYAYPNENAYCVNGSLCSTVCVRNEISRDFKVGKWDMFPSCIKFDSRNFFLNVAGGFQYGLSYVGVNLS